MDTLEYVMKNLWYLVGAYAFIWVFIGGYMINLGMRIKKLEQSQED
jgi:CcmD family protein